MVIVMKNNATQDEIDEVIERIESKGLRTQKNIGELCLVIGVIGDKTKLVDTQIESMSGVNRTISISSDYKIASRQFSGNVSTVIDVNGTKIGGKNLAVMAGPCAVESVEQIVRIAKEVAKGGANFLRGGAFKPRSTPYSFQGYGKEGLKMLAAARDETGLGVVTEVMTPHEAELVAEYADILQIGARNMQNFYLLREVGRQPKPVLLKRGLSATIKEWLLAAEYILYEGNQNVILCERGIRTYETHTRNTLDLNAVPAIKELSHLPVIVDPSHGTGRRSFVTPLAKAGIAVGGDGLMIEVHHKPDQSMTSDGAQSITPEQFAQLIEVVRPVANAVGREI